LVKRKLTLVCIRRAQAVSGAKIKIPRNAGFLLQKRGKEPWLSSESAFIPGRTLGRDLACNVS
jgi:hypothetical protein